MAKKNELLKYAGLAAAALALIALIMLFLPAATITVGEDTITYTGFDLIFGYTKVTTVGNSKITNEIFEFSFMNLLTLILLVAVIVLNALNFFMKKNKLFSLIAGACAIVAAIFFFCMVAFSVVTIYEGNILGSTVSTPALDKEKLVLGIGAILGGILSILAGGAQAADILLNK